MRCKTPAGTLRRMVGTTQRRTELLRGVLDLCLLAVMDEGPAYGYEMTKRLKDRGLTIVGERIRDAETLPFPAALLDKITHTATSILTVASTASTASRAERHSDTPIASAIRPALDGR